jgi:hypothetical protein
MICQQSCNKELHPEFFISVEHNCGYWNKFGTEKLTPLCCCLVPFLCWISNTIITGTPSLPVTVTSTMYSSSTTVQLLEAWFKWPPHDSWLATRDLGNYPVNNSSVKISDSLWTSSRRNSLEKWWHPFRKRHHAITKYEVRRRHKCTDPHAYVLYPKRDYGSSYTQTNHWQISNKSSSVTWSPWCAPSLLLLPFRPWLQSLTLLLHQLVRTTRVLVW